MQDIHVPETVPVEKSYYNLSAVQESLAQSPIFQYDENDIPRLVITHEPEFAQTLGSIHPDAFLFSKAVDLKLAKQQHRNFRETIRKHTGALVFTVREILLMGCDDLRHRAELEEFASHCIHYRLENGLKQEDLSEKEVALLDDEYKRASLKKMTDVQLVDVIMSQPTIIIEKPDPSKHFVSHKIEMEPLTNLTFCRDQQITTAKGVVMGSMNMVQRQMETLLMLHVFKKLGIPIVGKIPAEEGATLEGGDFLPGGSDICFIGCGLRTNMKAIDYMLRNDLFGTRRVAVVEDKWDINPDRLHLDTVFGLLDAHNCIVSEDIIGEESKIKRLVTEYVKNDISGQYEISVKEMEFTHYLRENKYNIIPIPADVQLVLGCNILNIGKGRIICTHETCGRLIVEQAMKASASSSSSELTSPPFTGSVHVIPFSEIVSMNGGVHCASFVCRYPPDAQFVTRMATPGFGPMSNVPNLSSPVLSVSHSEHTLPPVSTTPTTKTFSAPLIRGVVHGIASLGNQ